MDITVTASVTRDTAGTNPTGLVAAFGVSGEPAECATLTTTVTVNGAHPDLIADAALAAASGTASMLATYDYEPDSTEEPVSDRDSDEKQAEADPWAPGDLPEPQAGDVWLVRRQSDGLTYLVFHDGDVNLQWRISHADGLPTDTSCFGDEEITLLERVAVDPRRIRKERAAAAAGDEAPTPGNHEEL